MGLTDGPIHPAPKPHNRDALLDEEEQGEEGVPSLSWGPPLEYRKEKGAAMKEMREVRIWERLGGKGFGISGVV